ncbi:hypothetical protein SIID45300_02148 [Candidatus Magnetaquicoccaceae bacterium FCR-1]|uniref:Lipoprotein n=2 Tax=Candidatus Magnetaquiglobus chichijimensis TaxID=3141448 RepID=A0ABQ0CAA8_9PROT
MGQSRMFFSLIPALMVVAGCKEIPPNYYENEGTTTYYKQKNYNTNVYANDSRRHDHDLVKRCIRDNRNEDQRRRTVEVYCRCMREQMPEHETRSISEWERHHPKAVARCESKAGWR